MVPLKQALAMVFKRRGQVPTIGDLEVMGAYTTPKAWYRLHLINVVSEPRKETWTRYYKMTDANARFWRDNATSGRNWMAFLEKFVDQEGWVEV